MYTLENDEQIKGAKILVNNDLPVCCPFMPPMQIQNSLGGQPKIIFRNCGSWCALFQTQKEPHTREAPYDHSKVFLTCGTGTGIIVTEKKQPIKPAF